MLTAVQDEANNETEPARLSAGPCICRRQIDSSQSISAGAALIVLGSPADPTDRRDLAPSSSWLALTAAPVAMTLSAVAFLAGPLFATNWIERNFSKISPMSSDSGQPRGRQIV